MEYSMRSVFDSTYTNWELCIIDDSDAQNMEELVNKFIQDNPQYECCREKIKHYPTGDNDDSKRKRGESIHGQFGTKAMYETDGDICTTLCDDDALCKDYLSNLNVFYSQDCNKDINYSFGHLIPFNPTEALDTDTPLCDIKWLPFHLNKLGPVMPGHVIDSTQHSWRTKAAREIGLIFPSPLTVNLDASMYAHMSSHWGECPCNGFMSQYKGWYPQQMGRLGSVPGGTPQWKLNGN